MLSASYVSTKTVHSHLMLSSEYARAPTADEVSWFYSPVLREAIMLVISPGKQSVFRVFARDVCYSLCYAAAVY